MIQQAHTCPKCGEDILFEGEHDSAEDFNGYNFGMCAPEYQDYCKCDFTDKEIEEMEIEVATNYTEDLGNDY